MNTVNSENFNSTMEGYIKRALDEIGAPIDVRKDVFKGLRWAKDYMTMEDARSYDEDNAKY